MGKLIHRVLASLYPGKWGMLCGVTCLNVVYAKFSA